MPVAVMPPPVVIDVRAAEEPRDVVHHAAQALVEGKLVAFPTETVYGLAALALDAPTVARLSEVKGREANHPFTLAIRSADEAVDYVPDMSRLAARLARRCWPGPVTLVLDNSHGQGLTRRLPASVQEVVSPGRTIGLRVPGHPMVLDVLRLIAGPLVLTSANRTGGPEAVTASEVVAAFGADVPVVLDDGPCRFGQPSTVVRVQGDRYEILREGVVPGKTIGRLSNHLVVFVCAGNTCRSPMAEAICRKHVAARLGCQPDQLDDRGVMVTSAGVAAACGGRASSQAVEVMAEMGLDLSGHEPQPLTESLVRAADRIYAMTAAYRQTIVTQWPGAAARTQLLCPDGSDVCDPIGGPVERYQRCAAEIESAILARLDEMLS